MRKLESISIVTPCFNEEESIERCINEVRRIMTSRCPGVTYEHLVVDNASTDRTVEIVERLVGTDPRLKLIVNSRNVGASRSMLNALKYCHREACIPFLPADLQDPPEIIPEFIRLWELGYDRVFGIRKNRKEHFLMRKARSLYYRVLSRLSSTEIPQGAGEFQLLDSSVVRQLAKVQDHYPFVRGLIAMTGARSVGVEYDWGTRTAGSSQANLVHLFDLGINGLLSTSKVPARAIFVSGACVSLGSFVYASVALLLSIFEGSSAGPGVNTVVIALFFFSGVQLMSIALIGEYVISIHSQVRPGPAMYVAKTLNLEIEDEKS